MREIKFRAYDKVNKKMIYGVGVMGNKLMPNTEVYASSWKVGQTLYDALQEIDQFFEAIEQYTGLKDKNGKEIYEGDLLKIRIDSNVQDNVYHVKDLISFARDTSDEIDPYYRWSDEGEVIGNVHENGELVK